MTPEQVKLHTLLIEYESTLAQLKELEATKKKLKQALLECESSQLEKVGAKFVTSTRWTLLGNYEDWPYILKTHVKVAYSLPMQAALVIKDNPECKPFIELKYNEPAIKMVVAKKPIEWTYAHGKVSAN